MKKRNITLFTAFAAAVAFAPATQAANIVVGNSLIPTGLGVDDTFQLVFVSSTTRDATSNDVADYDTHVQNAANAATTFDLSGYTWEAIASTNDPLVHARNHVSVTADVYLVNGTKVSSASNFLTDSFGGLDAAINIDENGTVLNSDVWTGSNFEGYRNNNGLGTLGGNPIGVDAGFGRSDVTGQQWAGEAGLQDQDNLLPFYAVSEVLTVIVPEPATMSLLAIGGIALIRRRRRA
jgi:hypothetical protein